MTELVETFKAVPTPITYLNRFGTRVAMAENGESALVQALGGIDTGLETVYLLERQPDTTWVFGDNVPRPVGASGYSYGLGLAFVANGASYTALVGADTLVGSTGPGQAFIFQGSPGGNWVLEETLVPTMTTQIAQFGYSAALSSSAQTALVGAYNEDVGRGAVYIYQRQPDTTWPLESKITGPTGSTSTVGQFGISTALANNGTTALIGAPSENMGFGAAYVYQRQPDTTWLLEQRLPGVVQYSNFGCAVAMSPDGQLAVVGANGFLDPNPLQQGAAYVFRRQSGPLWVQQQVLTASDGFVGDLFGTRQAVAVASDAKSLLIGAPALVTFSPLLNKIGAAYRFVLSGSSFVEQQKLLPSDGHTGMSFGESLGLGAQGTRAMIGAPLATVQTIELNGAAYAFEAMRIAPVVTLQLQCPRQPFYVYARKGWARVCYPMPTTNLPATIKCTPPRGSRLPVGYHLITCTARRGQLRAKCKFAVIVKPCPFE